MSDNTKEKKTRRNTHSEDAGKTKRLPEEKN